MKLNRLETHDRYEQFQNQWNVIASGYEECLKNVPETINFPIYIFAHPRTIEYDEKVSILKTGAQIAPSTRLIWTPRATKPKAQTNSYLFLGKKNSDIVQTIWLLPPRELWDQYSPGKLTHNEDIWTCIQNFIHHRDALNAPDPDAPNEKQIEYFRKIYGEAAHERKVEKEKKQLLDRLYLNI